LPAWDYMEIMVKQQKCLLAYALFKNGSSSDDITKQTKHLRIDHIIAEGRYTRSSSIFMSIQQLTNLTFAPRNKRRVKLLSTNQ
jgi:hypothetical protein